MLAESVRKPLNGLQSRIGVLPVAMNTIIVSPTARPKPIITAAKMPGLAEGKHHAPQRLPAAGAQGQRRGRQVVRDARQRILGDRKDDRDHGESQAEATTRLLS